MDVFHSVLKSCFCIHMRLQINQSVFIKKRKKKNKKKKKTMNALIRSYFTS